jgi:dephospho-CoA kinase
VINLGKVIGLTGSIASGKSTVSRELKQLGYQVIDCDEINHTILLNGNIGYTNVLAEFGPDILDENNEIDRKKLGNIIFNDKTLKEKLNQILHPLIKDIVKEEIDKVVDGIVFLDCPLLFETDFHELCNLKIVVYVNMDMQISRLMERDGITFPEALKKIYAQMSLDEKLSLADYVIDNCHSLGDLDWQIKQLLFRLERMV